MKDASLNGWVIGIFYANFDKLLRGLDKERHSNA